MNGARMNHVDAEEQADWYEVGTGPGDDGRWWVWDNWGRAVHPATPCERWLWQQLRDARRALHAEQAARTLERVRLQHSFVGWLHWLCDPSEEWRPPLYLRLFNGLMQVVARRRLPIAGAGTPGHGERHRWWLDLRHPFRSCRCWWCGLEGTPGLPRSLISFRRRPFHGKSW